MYALLLFLRIFLPNETATLEIKVTNVNTTGGTFRVAVYQRKDEWLGDLPTHSFETAVSEEGQVIIKTIPPGTYAVAIYQDINSDGELNKNFFGIPKEPYGFSNNKMGSLGPPGFETSSIVLAGNTSIQIELID